MNEFIKNNKPSVATRQDDKKDKVIEILIYLLVLKVKNINSLYYTKIS